VFVSYRRDDAAAHAGRLYDALAARFGAGSVFMDVDAIGLGSDYRETIDGAIASCDAAIALIGRGWVLASDEDGRRRLDDPNDVLRMELEQALSHRLVVIPALVGGAALPDEEDLPASIAPLVRRQGIELRDSTWRDDVARLMRRLEAIPAAASAVGVPAPTDAPPTQPRGRRRLLLAVIAAAAVAAGLALFLALRPDEGGGGEGDGSNPPAGREALDRLLAAIPQPVRTNCDEIDYGPESALASVGCSAARVAVNYHLFGPDILDGWYTLHREEVTIEPDTGTCGEGMWRGEAAYAVGDEPAGRSVCFMDGDEPNLIWTDARNGVGAEANVWQGTGQPAAQSLLRQWECCLRPQP
jgi:TIR domain